VWPERLLSVGWKQQQAAILGLSLALLALVLTLFFKKTIEVEERIAAPGTQLDGIRNTWGNGPIGRWMRVVHVYFFFVFRNLPRIGARIESRMGDENETLPVGLKLWVMLPVSVFFTSIALSIFAAWYLEAFN